MPQRVASDSSLLENFKVKRIPIQSVCSLLRIQTPLSNFASLYLRSQTELNWGGGKNKFLLHDSSIKCEVQTFSHTLVPSL